MATIEQRGDSYRVAWRLGGKRTGSVQSCTFTGSATGALAYAEAAKKFAEARGHAVSRAEVYQAVLGRDDEPAGMPTLAEWVITWAKAREEGEEIQPDTLAEYLRVLSRRVLPRIGALYLSDINHDVIADWVRWVKTLPGRTKGHPVSAQTVRHTHALLHQVLGAAVPKWLPANPAARPLGRRGNTVGLPKVVAFDAVFLEPWELALILSHCSKAIRDLAFVAVRTGLRLGELLALRVEHLVLTGKRPLIRVRVALKSDGTIGPPKSGKSVRDVTIGSEVVNVLTARVAGRKRADLVFPTSGAGMRGRSRNLPWRRNNLYRRHWQPAVAAAQRCPDHPPKSPVKTAKTGPVRRLRLDEVSDCTCPGVLRRTPRIHDLRHTHVSVLVELGWTPKRVQLRVGHASFLTTMDIYGHLWERGDKGGLDAMERLLTMADDEDE